MSHLTLGTRYPDVVPGTGTRPTPVRGTSGPKRLRHGLLLWPVVSRFGSLGFKAELGSAGDKLWHVPSASPWHCSSNDIAGWTCLDEVQYREGRTGLLPRPRQCRLNHSHIPAWLDFAHAKPPTAGALLCAYAKIETF